MGQICGCLTHRQDYELLDLKQRNLYIGQHKQKQKIKTILNAIAKDNDNPDFQQLASFISNQNRLQFIDPFFQKMQTSIDSSSQSLQKMYDFKRKKLEKVYNKKQTPLSIFDQKQVQLCYLTCVFYAISQSNQLKQRIFITQNINPYFAYIIQLYCQGKPTNVVVDDKVPVINKNIKYLSLTQAQQIWPYLLQKAWCKQIGRYQKALGLSPDDCFQQLTGIPSNSYPLHGNFHLVKQAKRLNYWVVLIAKRFQKQQGLKSRQVFCVQKIDESSNVAKIRSPYKDFQLAKSKSIKNGVLQVSQVELLQMFQFFTIGFYTPGYVLKSYEHTSLKNQQVIYQLKLNKRQKINLRFIQSYQQYKFQKEINPFFYSPVFIQLYDQKYNLIKDCDGKPENLTGCRSSKFSHFDFIELNEGLYYVRVIVDWNKQNQPCTGNLVLYSADGTPTLTSSNKKDIDLMPLFLSSTISMSRVINENKQQQLKLRYMQKTNGYIIAIQNLVKTSANIKLILKDSQNVRINHQNLVDKTLTFNLNGLEQIILQVLPQNPREEYCLSAIDVIRIQK